MESLDPWGPVDFDSVQGAVEAEPKREGFQIAGELARELLAEILVGPAQAFSSAGSSGHILITSRRRRRFFSFFFLFFFWAFLPGLRLMNGLGLEKNKKRSTCSSSTPTKIALKRKRRRYGHVQPLPVKYHPRSKTSRRIQSLQTTPYLILLIHTTSYPVASDHGTSFHTASNHVT